MLERHWTYRKVSNFLKKIIFREKNIFFARIFKKSTFWSMFGRYYTGLRKHVFFSKSEKNEKRTENITFFDHLSNIKCFEYTLITWTRSFGLDKDLVNLVKDLPSSPLDKGSGPSHLWTRIWAKPQGSGVKPALNNELSMKNCPSMKKVDFP